MKSDRNVCRQQKANEVLSPRAKHRRGFAVGKLPDFETLSVKPLAEALADNTPSPA